jgi:hypothetical protein
MDQSRYVEWYPRIPSLAVCRLSYDDGCLEVNGLYKDGMLAVNIKFSGVLFSSISYEGVRLRLIEDLETPVSLVLVDKSSDLIRWVKDESFRARDLREARHYLIFIGNEVVDVISVEEPEICQPQVSGPG